MGMTLKDLRNLVSSLGHLSEDTPVAVRYDGDTMWCDGIDFRGLATDLDDSEPSPGTVVLSISDHVA
jgi:hypothetical protein